MSQKTPSSIIVIFDKASDVEKVECFWDDAKVRTRLGELIREKQRFHAISSSMIVNGDDLPSQPSLFKEGS